MKQYSIYFAIALLMLASLACQAVTGGRQEATVTSPPVENTEPETGEPTPANSDNSNSDSITSEFPLPEDATNVTEAGGTTIFSTKLSLDEVMDFYREQYTSKGYAEREILTVVSDTTFSMAFDGDPSGEAVIVQGVDLGDGTSTISLRLEDV